MQAGTGKPAWGWLDVVIVYLGIMVLGIIFGLYSEPLMAVLTKLGIADSILTYFSLGFLLQFTVTIGLVVLISRVFHQADWKTMGFRRVSCKDIIKYGILGGFLLMAVVMLLGLPVQILKPDLPPQTYEEMLRSSQGAGQFIWLIVMGVILAPLSEEIFYRGMLYPLVRYSAGPIWGAILAGLIFGVVHWDLWRTIPLAAGGVILCFIYEKTGSIWVTTLAHGIWNGIMTLAVYLSMGYYQ